MIRLKKWHRSRGVIEALGFALSGLRTVFVREQNVRIQGVIGTLVVCAMFFFRVPSSQIAVGVLAILLVATLEMINTSFEIISDFVHPEYSHAIKQVKDVSAGAVLLASIGAGIIGILIFIPALINYYAL